VSDYRMHVAVADDFVSHRSVVLAGMMLLLVTANLHAEDAVYRFKQVQTVRGPCCGDMGVDLVVDDNDSVLVAGRRGGLDLDRDGTVDLDTYGTPDSLVFMSHDGNMSGWIQGPGGPKQDSADGIASDRRGGAYAAGTFTDTLNVGDDAIAGAGNTDGFLIRFDPDGNPLWTVAIGGAHADRLHDVSSDADGNAYVSGTVRGPVDLDNDGDTDVPASSTDTFLVASFDPEGRLRWSRTFEGGGVVRISTIFADDGGAVYVGGAYMAGALDLDADGAADVPEAITLEAPGGPADVDMNAFYARLDTAGDVVWVNAVSGPGIQVVGALAVAGNGDLLVLGGYLDDADFDADGEAELEWQSLGSEQVWEHGQDASTFLLRASPAGERRWVRRYAAGGSHVAAFQDRLLLGGSYTGVLDLDADGNPESHADPDEWQEGFIALLDGAGDLQQVFTIVGGDADAVLAVGATSDGSKLYATGYTRLGADFDADGKIESESKCHQLGDVYLALYEPETGDASL
jgi:hypothetical protein